MIFLIREKAPSAESAFWENMLKTTPEAKR